MLSQVPQLAPQKIVSPFKMHKITNPGLDYNYCGQCGRYIIRDCEIERLKNLIADRLAKKRGKEAQEIQAIINREKSIRETPCLSKPSNVPIKLLTTVGG